MKKVILLIHGWNYRNYTSQTKEIDAWHNREELVKRLEKNYDVYKLNLPGFCGEAEPDREWNLSDFADYINKYIKEHNLDIDYILGYSFGGSVAIRYKTKYKAKQKLILVSPAIIRTANNSRKFIKTPQVLQGLRNCLRDFYVIHILKTNEMVYGTKFLRKSYQLIVREDLEEEVKEIPKNDFVIIYGDEDEQVNPHKVIDYLGKDYMDNIDIIKGGKHNIGATHPKEIEEAILKYTLK